ncbi:YciI family protein [Demequina sp. NBRC 110056]|uniref:YciI family protein n=1 Tax=Demequina sp. NBRC 110056 TaxID=1570345 RepID=UPI000A052F95|nr:YciI family protein [Demequina sp. NBRC 110056]
MATYLISFPSTAFDVPPEDFDAVSDASRAVVAAAKAAGAWVFGGAIDESVATVLVSGDGTVTEGSHPETAGMGGGYALLEIATRDEAVEWAARFAAACRCPQELRVFHFDPES